MEAGFRFWCRLLACCVVVSATVAARAATSDNQRPAAHARVVVDEVGRRVTIPDEVHRVVSLAPNLTETVYALGLEDDLAGDTDYCDYPAEAKKKPHVGGSMNPSLEAILALKPDLVLATTVANRRDTVTALERLGIAVYTTAPQTVEGTLAEIRTIATLLGRQSAGEELAQRLQERLDAIQKKLAGSAPTRVLFVVWEDPLITVGRGTFIADALKWAGAESVVDSKQNWPRISLEEAVRLKPEYLVFAGEQNQSEARVLAELRSRAGLRSLPAVEQGRVAVISEAVDRPAPRLVDAIEELAEKLHLERFGRKENAGVKTANGKAPVSEDETNRGDSHRRPWGSFTVPAASNACSR